MSFKDEMVIRELVDEMLDKMEEFEEESGEEDDYQEEEEDNEMVQLGGAPLTVSNKCSVVGDRHFKGLVESVKMDIKIPRLFTVSPHGPELFGHAIVNLVKMNVPVGMVPANLRVGVIFESDELAQSIGLAFQDLSKITSEDVVQSMAEMAQSNKNVLELNSPKVTARITYLNPEAGSGKHPIDIGDILELAMKRKRTEESEEATASGVLDDEAREESCEEESEGEDIALENITEEVKPEGRNIMKNDVTENCLPHALLQVLTYYEWKQDKLNKKKRERHQRTLKKRQGRANKCVDVFLDVKKMKQEAGMTKSTNFDRLDVEQFQKTVFAEKFQLVVFIRTSSIPFYAGPYVGKGKELTLYLNDGHYSGVRSICRLLKSCYYCGLCNRGYRNAAGHYACKLLHRLCGQQDCPISPDDVKTQCQKCLVSFRSRKCYENHLKKGPRGGKSRCDYTVFCKRCGESYYRNKNTNPHVCGEKYCHRCQCTREEGHKCTMMPSVKNERNLTRRRVFFDIESRADDGTGQQHPVLFVGLRCCPLCSQDIPKDLSIVGSKKCSNCAPDGRLKIVECIQDETSLVDVASEMTKWLFDDHHRGAVVVAHNASGYDGQFILENMIASNKASPEICLDGTKLIYMNYNRVRLLDSLKFLAMSLANVGKTFQVDSVKGDFPVMFIKPENYDYVGPLPDNQYYALESKSPAVRKQMIEFLEKERAANKTFNFREDLLKYCYNDVYILAVSMTIFEKAFEAMNNVCLLEESTTIASATVTSFRRNHLDPDNPTVLDASPSASINCSIISQKYLAWFSAQEDVQVDMSTEYGEKKIGNYRVDGFIEPCDKFPQGQVIEFLGCYHHAHDCMYSEESVIEGRSGKEIREADKKRFAELRNSYPVEIVHECEVRKALTRDKEMFEFFDSYEVMDLLQREKALVGGRTEVFKTHVKFDEEVGRYVDVVSLYPTVMKHESYPVGEPENVPRSTMKTPMTAPGDIPFEGFLSCKVIAPRDLKTPVLPGKVSARLMFFLCKKCAKAGNQKKCTHSDEERAFTGTYTTVELKKALSLGYVITQVYHGVKYEKWAKNDENGQGGLFTSFINKNMEEKIYSSGWPSDVVTEEEKDAYCRGYAEKEHIQLDDHSRFEKNPGKRAVAKVMLNSLWGKFAQRVDRVTTKIIVDPSEFWKIVYDTTLVLLDVRPVNDVLIVKFKKQAEALSSLKTSAIHLAAYTTSYARLRLYRLMELAGADKIIYSDTDSIIYSYPKGGVDPLAQELGTYLGQLTDELEGEMLEFVTLGPKTYSYKQRLPNGEVKLVRKAKGITINSEVERRVNFEVMKMMVDEVLQGIETENRTILELPQHKITRDKDHRVYSKETKKSLRYTFNKRRLLPDGTTLPFGYFE